MKTRTRTCAIAAVLLAGAGGCRSGNANEIRPETDQAALRSRAHLVIDQALRGDLAGFHESLSTKCQRQIPLADLEFALRYMQAEVGQRPRVNIEAAIVRPGSGTIRRVFPESDLGVDDSTWIYERNEWRLDECE